MMRTTPATREFTDEPVDDTLLHDILDVARFAPSGGNRQGWHVIVVRDPAIRRHLRDLYVIGWREYWAYASQGLVPFAPTGPRLDHDEARVTPAPNAFADHLDEVPVLLIVTVDLGALAVTDIDVGRHSVVGGGSVYPFTHNILLAARDAGLGGVMTTILARQEPAVRDLLQIPEPHVVAGMVALGHPVRTITKLRRDPVDAFTTVDRFTGKPFRP